MNKFITIITALILLIIALLVIMAFPQLVIIGTAVIITLVIFRFLRAAIADMVRNRK
jgi:hypothetical protein